MGTKRSSEEAIQSGNSSRQNRLSKLADMSIGVKILSIAVVALMLAVIFFAFLYFDEKNGISNLSENGIEEKKREEAREVVESLGESYVLPDEEPTVATIVDVDLLQDENSEFYEDARDGDRLIIFVEKKLAFIYRIEDEMIINVATVNFDSSEEVEETSSVKQ